MRKLRVVMIDGFKPAYLAYAPYLRSLVEQHQWGSLEMTPGHWGCIQTLFEGRSSILSIFYKHKPTLRFIRKFLFLRFFGGVGRLLIDMLINFPRFLRGEELFKTGKIPLRQLSSMDISVGKHFAKKKWISFSYFGALDELGHLYGPTSEEIKKAVRKIDAQLAGKKFDLIFSDHGMVAVEKVVEVPITRDCFIDSDMARYWGEEKILAEIKKNLPLDDGAILDWPDKQFGELIFMARNGVLLYPNFFNKKIVKGMHGYDGKHPDMLAFYVLNKKGTRKDLKVHELHTQLMEMKKQYGIS